MTLVPCDASICCALFPAVGWLTLNYCVCPRRNTFHFPLFKLFHIDLRPPCSPHSSLPPRKHRLFNHVNASLNPLHRHKHQMYRGASNSLTFTFWIAQNSQAHSGEYSSHVDNSFAVVGQLLDTLPLPKCEGAEFESDIWAEMKRRKEDGVRQWVSNR